MGKKPKTEHEDVLRDFIAGNLHLIEHGLRLEKTEYYLPNHEGSKGYVDILAFDKYDNYVIIEVKRKDMAAREALHELHKYVRLLRQNYGAVDGDFRLITVSTEWHQLYSAFAEFKINSPYMCEGYAAESTKNGFALTKMEISDKFNIRKLSQRHTAVSFESHEERSQSRVNFEKYMKEVGFSDYLLVDLDINRKIPFPYTTYICFRRAPEDYYINKTILSVSDEQRESDDIIDDYENLLTIGLLDSKVGYTDIAVGYPARFHNLLAEGWNISAIYKYGMYSIDPRMKDDFIISEISSYSDENHVVIKTNLNSGNRSRYLSVKNALLSMLEDNPVWFRYAERIFDEIDNHKDVDIAIHVYNPMNILVNLNEAFHDASKRHWVPSFVIAARKGDFSKFYCGSLEWNGRSADFERLKIVLGSGEYDYFDSLVIGTHPEWESRILPSLGLKYSTKTLEPLKLGYDFESKAIEVLYSSFEKFIERNNIFLNQLEGFMSSTMVQVRYDTFPEL